jgi:PPK2 family polyphosphate:nucleotide phosphotransferase
MSLSVQLKSSQKVKLSELDPNDTHGVSEEESKHRRDKLIDELGDLQEVLYAAKRNSVLIVLQGMDTSGKDGTIRHVMSGMNPQGCRVESFKVPTEEELEHDFLWRVHKVTPRKGITTIFNRSHYEDVLVVRVHQLAPHDVWKKRYDHINDFEKLLAHSGTIVLKFFLHISREEQKERLLEREKDPEKAWKLSVGDWKERSLWDDYMEAYEDVLSRCSSEHSPWYVVPANKKWFRNLAVAEALVDALRPYRDDWENYLSKLSQERIEELARMRAEKS